MNKFENPQDIINKETLVDAEKLAPTENAKIAQEQLSEIKNSIAELKIYQKKVSNKIDEYIDNLSDAIESQEHYQIESKLHDLQAESTSISLKIEDKITQLQLIVSSMNKIKDLDQSSMQN